MSRRTKRWLIIATVLVVAGCVCFGGALTMLGWNFNKLSIGSYKTVDHKITDSFKNISIETDTSDIIFERADRSSVSSYERKNVSHTVTVRDDTLVITVRDTRKWYEHIGINFKSPKITVYLPEGDYGNLVIDSHTGNAVIPDDFTFENMNIRQSTGNVESEATVYGDIKIKASTGKIKLNDLICVGDISLKTSTGKTELCDIRCKNLESEGSTGSIILEDVVTSGKMTIERDTGNVRFNESDAAEIYVETDTGNISGTLLSDKTFFASSDTGKIDLPKTMTGGRCELETDTGNIRIEIK